MLISILLVGCSASLQRPPSDSLGDGVGVVSYFSSGSDGIMRARREDARKKMRESCNGEYEVVSESLVPASRSSSDVVIRFKCL